MLLPKTAKSNMLLWTLKPTCRIGHIIQHVAFHIKTNKSPRISYPNCRLGPHVWHVAYDPKFSAYDFLLKTQGCVTSWQCCTSPCGQTNNAHKQKHDTCTHMHTLMHTDTLENKHTCAHAHRCARTRSLTHASTQARGLTNNYENTKELRIAK